MSRFLDIVREQLSYALSLPERSIRSLAAVAGGTTSLLTDTLFPEVLRGTTLYKVFVGDAQQFVIQKVAQVQQEGQARAEDSEADSSYVQKKMIGGALETAGLFAMHFSPLWVFAIAGDAAAGTSVFLSRLVEQLKRNGVVADDAEIKALDDLLAATQEASRRSAAAIDTPPLSREDLSKLASEMRTSYGEMFSKTTDLLPRLETIWQRMEKLASRENVSLERLGGILTVDVASWGKKGIGSALAVGQTGTALFGEKILDSYARTLDAVGEEGVAGYVSHRMAPFLQAATAHFDPAQKTWTESLANRLLGGGKADEPESPVPDTALAEQADTGGDTEPGSVTPPPQPPDAPPPAGES